MSGKKITTSYVNASRLNQIIFDHYVCDFVTSEGCQTIVQQIQEAYNVNNISMSNHQIEQLQSLGFPVFWEQSFSTAMIYFYELREMVPPYSVNPGIIIPIEQPNELGMCVYAPKYQYSTPFDYIDLFFKNENDLITFDVDELILFASTDPNLSEEDRVFISTLIGE